MGWRSVDAERAEGIEVGRVKEVRGGDKGEWLGEGRTEEMGRGGVRWAKERRCSVFGFDAQVGVLVLLGCAQS